MPSIASSSESSPIENSWAIAWSILDVPLSFDGRAVAVTVLGGGAATLVFGMLGALAALSVRPARRLRSS